MHKEEQEQHVQFPVSLLDSLVFHVQGVHVDCILPGIP